MIKIREPIVEGIFYPSDREKLKKLVISLLGSCDVPEGEASGIISPHAGYRYSGAIAAAAFQSARRRNIKRAVIIAPIHRDQVDTSGAIIFPESGQFKMPLGLINVDQNVIEELLSCGTQFVRNDIPHLEEHSIEVQLPFLQVLFPRAAIIPILVGRIGKKAVTALKRALALTLETDYPTTLFIVSANLTSFMQGTDAKIEAETLLQFIFKNDTESLLSAYEAGTINTSGATAIAVLLALFDGQRTVKVLSSGNSAQTNKDLQSLVHYAAIGFF
jgi:AmmeMemoRadiSam system protein B